MSGVAGHSCTIDASRSNFTNNGFDGLEATDGSGTIDACVTSGNGNDGFFIDVGLFTIRNSFAVRNVGAGFNIAGTQGTSIEFDTAADNGAGFACGTPGFAFPNNLIVRNGSNISTSCTYPTSLISDVTIGINFTSPDVAPYDYHIGAASLAIDMATTASSNDVDYDGDARPQGASKDVGADEFKP